MLFRSVPYLLLVSKLFSIAGPPNNIPLRAKGYLERGRERERERDSNIRGSSEVHISAVEAHCPACSILPGDETSRLHGKYILNFFYKL